MREIVMSAKKEDRSLSKEEHDRLDSIDDSIANIEGEIVSEERMQHFENRSVAENAPIEVSQEKDGLRRRDLREYSIKNVFLALAGNTKVGAFEREISDGISQDKRYQHFDGPGIIIPDDVLTQKRAITPGSFTGAATGGTNLIDDQLSPSFVDKYYNNMVLSDLGSVIYDGLEGTGDFDFAGLNTGATARWADEVAAVGESAAEFNQTTLTPERLGVYTGISNRTLFLNALNAEDRIIDNMAREMSVAFEVAAFHGSGSANHQPEGFYFQETTAPYNATIRSGIEHFEATGTLDGAIVGTAPNEQAGTITYADITSLFSRIEDSNAFRGRMGVATSPRIRYKLARTTKAGTTYPEFVWSLETPEMLASVPARITNSIRRNLVKGNAGNTRTNSAGNVCSIMVAGDWSQSAIGRWAGMRLVVDPYTSKEKGLVEYYSEMFTGWQVIRPAAFAMIVPASAE